MFTDTEIDQAAEEYLELHRPFLGDRFDQFLHMRAALAAAVRPTHHIHWEEKGGTNLARVAVAIRRTAGHTRSR